MKQEALPDIAPMRRGRPTTTGQKQTPSKPSSSPAKGDPFAALDSKKIQVRADAVDELSAKYPSVEQFSIALNKTSPFRTAMPSAGTKPDLDARVTHALADDAFARPRQVATGAMNSEPQSVIQSRTTSMRRSDKPNLDIEPRSSPVLHEPVAQRPGYTSTGTMTTESPPPPAELPKVKRRAIWRVPSHGRSSSQPRASLSAQAEALSVKPGQPSAQLPALPDVHRSKSQTTLAALSTSTSSSRPSLEGRRPSQLDVEQSLGRAKSVSSRARPPSGTHVDSNLDFLRERESSAKSRPSLELRRSFRDDQNETAVDDVPIENDTDYLKSLEDDSTNRRKSSHGHNKRASMPAMSLSGTKNAIAGKFGEAFKRFDRTNEEETKAPMPLEPLRTPDDQYPEKSSTFLSPISGSEATATPPRGIGELDAEIEELEEVPPEVRRELERRRLSNEEKRVAAAAAEYRNRPAGAAQGPSRASTIQKRVQSLLDEGRKSPLPRKTAEGYGRYTETRDPDIPLRKQVSAPQPSPAPARPFIRKAPMPIPSAQHVTDGMPPPASAQPAQPRLAPRPSAPPKPIALRTGTPVQGALRGPPTMSQPPSATSTDSAGSAASSQQSRLAALLAKDQIGAATHGSSAQQEMSIPGSAVSRDEHADWEADFSKRYPSLAGIEMVETEISTNGSSENGRRGMRIKDV